MNPTVEHIENVILTFLGILATACFLVILVKLAWAIIVGTIAMLAAAPVIYTWGIIAFIAIALITAIVINN